MIKVFVVDDSGVARAVLSNILSSDPELEVVGTADNGEEAVGAILSKKPDVVTMDVTMPRMDGFEATRRIMESSPVPIVIVSATLDAEEVDKSWQAMEAGAVACLQKPGYVAPGTESPLAAKLVQTVKLMSQVKLVRRWRKRAAGLPVEATQPVARAEAQRHDIRLVVVGASTGGPPVLNKILSKLPDGFRVPILVVQHIAPGFTKGFVDWLGRASSTKVGLAVHGEKVEAGHVYVAPDGLQMKIDTHGRISLTTDDPVNGLRPSVSYLFRSVAEAFGENAVGVLLTGMGRDGAVEMKMMRDAGALTIAQDKESSIVYGMPGEAAKLGGAKYSLSPDGIADMLLKLVK